MEGWGLEVWRLRQSDRRAAGLGRAPAHADPDRYAHRYAHCDVLVAGAGPAGIAAALSAAESGARVILCDETAEPGGSLLMETSALIEGQSALGWLQQSLASLAKNDRVTLLARTTAFGYFPHNLIGLNQRINDHLASPPKLQPRERLWPRQIQQHHIRTFLHSLEDNLTPVSRNVEAIRIRAPKIVRSSY